MENPRYLEVDARVFPAMDTALVEANKMAEAPGESDCATLSVGKSSLIGILVDDPWCADANSRDSAISAYGVDGEHPLVSRSPKPRVVYRLPRERRRRCLPGVPFRASMLKEKSTIRAEFQNTIVNLVCDLGLADAPS